MITGRAMLAGVAGVTGVETAEGEGSGTLGFRLRYGSEDIRRALFDAAVRHELCLLEVKRQHVSLEETFRKLTAGEKPAGTGGPGGPRDQQSPTLAA